MISDINVQKISEINPFVAQLFVVIPSDKKENNAIMVKWLDARIVELRLAIPVLKIQINYQLVF